MNRILVAYASKKGSTAQVAEVIAETLRQRGAHVDLVPAARVREPIDGYDMVVLGGAIYSGRWHAAAHRLLKRRRRELGRMPVAVFGMGPRTDTEQAWQRSRAQLDRALSKCNWLNPAEVTVFGGVDPPKKRTQRDLRDWDKIRAWAAEVATLATTRPTASGEAPPHSAGEATSQPPPTAWSGPIAPAPGSPIVDHQRGASGRQSDGE